MIPASLFPVPGPEAVRDFVLAMFAGGMNMGRAIVDAVFAFLESLGTGLA